MTIRPIVLHPDPRLKKVCPDVESVDDALRQLADDMLETMYDAPGIGLAAPQVGKNLRMFVMDCAPKEDDESDIEAKPRPMVLINPEIVSASETTSVYEEGCLSIPDLFADVERPESIVMRFLDRDGTPQEEEFSGIWATCAQHELDHLNGKLFIDYLSAIKRTMFTNKMKKLKKELSRGG